MAIPRLFHIFSFMMRRFLLLLLGVLPMIVMAQERITSNTVFQFTGLVVSETTGDSIPYARVQVNKSRRGAIANEEGFYSIAVNLRDTLHFSHVGYHGSSLVVAEYLKDYLGDRSQYIFVINYLLEDTFSLDEIVIFPYDTPDELRTAIVNMEYTETAQERAAKGNLSPDILHQLMESLPIDGGERVAVGRQMYYNQYQQQGIMQTAGINPVAAAQFLKLIADRAKKRKVRDLNYWTD